MHKFFTVYTEQVRSPYIEQAARGLPNPTHLEGKVRFDQAQDQQVVTTKAWVHHYPTTIEFDESFQS